MRVYVSPAGAMTASSPDMTHDIQIEFPTEAELLASAERIVLGLARRNGPTRPARHLPR